jgi:hypothetical protein
MRLVQSSRLAEEETKRLFAVDAVGGLMRLLQLSRLLEEETMRLVCGSRQGSQRRRRCDGRHDGSEELVAGAVVKALGGGDDAIVRRLRGGCRLACCSRQGSQRRRRLLVGCSRLHERGG